MLTKCVLFYCEFLIIFLMFRVFNSMCDCDVMRKCFGFESKCFISFTMQADPSPAILRSDFACYAVKFSPFDPFLIAVSTSQYYGIVGNGRQLICRITPGTGQLQIVRSFDTQDGLYDCAWNEMNQNQLVSGDGGGGIKLWDMNTQDSFPIAMWKEHQTEVSSVDWNLQTKDCFLSASWDNTIKLWTPMSQQSIRTFTAHTYCVYQALWSPRKANVFVSASGDHSVRIWDTNAPNPAMVLAPAHDGEVLSVDWNKYNENVIATAGVDRTIRLWDLRNQRAPYLTLPGHSFAVRRVKWSPHRADMLASVSYDMTCCLWSTTSPQPLVKRFEHHSEFAVGLDFNLFVPGQLATGSWDGHCAVWSLTGQRKSFCFY